ncbi:deoxyribodipyrimidine photo-lyase [Nakamurella flava]|uniref:Deoxyribodipyrimidine photo-lyase n=1 Tax=Nakamurella flava TaxID=2576308 RepID=A0A4V6CSK2_9ACTN|nr:deoxyribodipyrimidine photo-lyase [Nakamurella flava]TKV61915.1 deoxyribodipyrimidine photo-lyase [Nakamurella flava]
MTERSSAPALLWFRRDLRVGDHPALSAAIEAAGDAGVCPVFVVDDRLLQSSGAPRRHFLAGALAALDEQLGGNLLVVHGKAETTIPRLAKALGAGSVHASADYLPYGVRRDERVQQKLADQDVEWVTTGSPYAIAPGRVRKSDDTRYAVYTPFYKAWQQHGWRKPADSASAAKDATWLAPKDVAKDSGLKQYGIDAVDHRVGDVELPEPGEAAALARWKDFRKLVTDYDDDRNRPDKDGTSRLSVYLKYGCIHPRTLLAGIDGTTGKGAETFRQEIAWRDFYADVTYHRPDKLWTSLDQSIDDMQWDDGQDADEHFAAWQQGKTGYPYIDAGMRQLLAEGWMHNRVRMGTASFLIKDLHIPWQRGAAHFMEHLVDGDISSNNHGWQWVAGSGPGSSQFYRVFNPTNQGEKFDPDGDYVRRYVPELRDVPGGKVHQPWELPDGPPNGYPQPIVDHKAEREEALRRLRA